ncbi:sacsin N-terminal ATP-binding-like domain-containing protein [Dysgonomonas sp. 511]|uniref:sacsin N-terminal ATP-binding-like domain-containing protein n=1 Tax=Dysgonomonas sp. 511 TaxID=2302930 RepID=UPI0013D09B66|nr:DUF3883 domain-containing protein [Dysgonomonas sp. 511]NDV77818.1 DUF3883 domain-containing protein [Dysgonomonas sp. 511]
MTENLFIKNLSEEKRNGYGTPETAIDQANSCDALSSDIYTDDKRFIYELLQNADDASSQSGKLEFQIDFVQDYVIISHKGEQFSEVDIKSICSVGDGNKKGDENKTGFKGIGFKSVFAYSEFVIIKSGKFCFKFDKQECNKWNQIWGDEDNWKTRRKAEFKDDDIKMPWQIIPICTEIPTELKDLSVLAQDEYKVSTIIRHNKIEDLKKSLIDLFSESQIVLFLRSKEIQITINTDQTIVLEKLVIGNTTHLKRNNETISEWLIETTQFDVPQEVQHQIKDNNRYPRKLRESKKTEMSFAIQLEKGKIKSTDNEKRLLFTYLPTSVNLNLPFLINANFLTDAGRQNIHKDLEWNQWIFKQIPLKFFSWIAKLAEKNSKYKTQIFAIIPRKLTGYDDLESKFNEGYSDAINTIAFIPNQSGNLLKISEALLDDTNISNFINKQILAKYVNREREKQFSNSSFIPVNGKYVLKELGVEIFRVDDLENFFISDIFSTEHQLSENFNLISFLFEQANRNRKSNEDNDWNFRLKHIPFIFDEKEVLQKPEHIYFPSANFSEDFEEDICIVHEKIVEEINRNKQIKSWVESLGVKEPTDVSFIEKSIIGDSDFITKENAIKIGRYTFNAYKKGLLLEKHFFDLKNCAVLTKKGSLLKAQDCFLSDFYEPELKLERVCDTDFFVSDDYFADGDMKSEWKTFFLKMGIVDDIKSTNLTISISGESDKKKANRFDNIFIEKVKKASEKYSWVSYDGWTTDNRGYSFYATEIYCGDQLPFLQYTSDYQFSKMYFEKVFANISPSNIDVDKDVSVYGYTGFYGRSISSNQLNKQDSPTNYFKWVIENINIFPSVQGHCLKAVDVFNNNIHNIKEIAGRYLPVLDYDGIVSPEWLGLLGFKKQIEIQDYLDILTKISQENNIEEQQKNKKRATLIYQCIGELLPNLHAIDIEKIKNWSRSNRLLAKDGKFYFSKDLSLVTVDGFNANNLIYTDLKATDCIIDLFRLWGVNVINKVDPKFSSAIIKQDNLKTQLYHIAPLLALVAVEKSKSKKEWENEYNRITQKLSEISFYETTEIWLSYGDENDLQQKSTYSDGNNFYYVGNWYKPRVLDGLVEPLCKFLKIQYAERILTVLLSDYFSEGLDYLEEKGFDVSLIPENLKNPPIEERVPNQTIRIYNQSDEDLGRKGEMIVFEELKQIYSKKYNQPIKDTKSGFTIGSNIEVIWRNKDENTKIDHDFKVIENGKEIYIESKATSYGKNVEKVALYISGNELNLMETAEKYLIARVYDTFGNSSIEFVKLQLDNVTD